MKNHVLVLAALIVAVCAFPLFAQKAGGGSDALPALLVEVRALRVAVERAASSTPQVQLLAARLAVQNERLARATREADAARLELDQSQRHATGVAEEAAGIGRPSGKRRSQQNNKC